MSEEPSWIDHPAVLWENGNWMKLIPKSYMSHTEMSNTIARLSILGGVLGALTFRSFIFIGIAMLGILMSSQMAQKARKAQQTTPPTTNETPQTQTPPAPTPTVAVDNTKVAAQTKRRKKAPQLEYPQFKPGANENAQTNQQNLQSWANHFGAPGTQTEKGIDPSSGAMGAYVSMANPYGGSGLSEFAPSGAFDTFSGPEEGSVDPNLVPAEDVKEFRSGKYMLRPPFPRPATAAQELPQTSPFRLSNPYGAGFPTHLGPAPTAVPPQASEFVAPFEANAANRAMPPGVFQTPSGKGAVTWGAFASDGGSTSSSLTPPVPSGTVGQNFQTDYYTPRNLAGAGTPISCDMDMGSCFAPNTENPLGNVPLGLNGVARPRLCPPVDPRSQSQKFLTSLYESPGQQAAGYQFFQNPQQDMIAAQDAFLKWVYKDTQTHFKDKYSEPERAGLYNITDLSGPLGY